MDTGKQIKDVREGDRGYYWYSAKATANASAKASANARSIRKSRGSRGVKV